MEEQKQPAGEQGDKKGGANVMAIISYIGPLCLIPYLAKDSDYEKLVSNIKPEIIAVTKNDPQLEKKKRQVKKNGGQLLIVTNFIKNKSSRDLLKSFLFFR